MVISDEKIDEQDKVKEAEEKDIKKLMIDDEEEDRKLLESIPDESKLCLMLILSKVLCHEYVAVRSILCLSHLCLAPLPLHIKLFWSYQEYIQKFHQGDFW